ncbi:hypothetical protein J6590_019499 [Homalodisca vitripennis]|nr:hypothetical protein J6590_019499 [Homalodisca vitripennis]
MAIACHSSKAYSSFLAIEIFQLLFSLQYVYFKRVTVIVLPVHVEVEENDPVAWELILERNSLNHRMYNIHLTMLDPETESHPMPCDCSFMKCRVIKAFLVQQEQAEMIDDIIDCTTTDDND